MSEVKTLTLTESQHWVLDTLRSNADYEKASDEVYAVIDDIERYFLKDQLP